jgi:hypothetical protein
MSDEPDDEIVPLRDKEELMQEAKEIYSSLTTAEKVDSALPMVVGLDEHDSEMDAIAAKAVRTFEDLVSLGGNVPDMHAGKIFEVAGQMLKTALEAKNAKAEKKLRMIELQLKKVRAEQIDYENGLNKGITSTGGDFDRNELLKHLWSSKPPKPDEPA